MATIIERFTPTHYYPTRIAFQRNGGGQIVAMADFTIYNVLGRQIGDDHPTVTLNPSEAAAFLSWFNAKTDAYEAATGLALYVPPEPPTEG